MLWTIRNGIFGHTLLDASHVRKAVIYRRGAAMEVRDCAGKTLWRLFQTRPDTLCVRSSDETWTAVIQKEGPDAFARPAMALGLDLQAGARRVTVTQTPQRTFTASGGVRITGILCRTAVLDAAEPMDDAWAALLYALALILLFQDDAVV
jgi:hypothetical protein